MRTFFMGKWWVIISLSLRSTTPSAIPRAVLSPPFFAAGASHTPQCSKIRTALRVMSSGSPGPTPITYNFPFIFFLS